MRLQNVFTNQIKLDLNNVSLIFSFTYGPIESHEFLTYLKVCFCYCFKQYGFDSQKSNKTSFIFSTSKTSRVKVYFR